MKCTPGRSILLTALLSLTATALPQQRRDNGAHPVCIVGAGPAGLSAAARLEEKGVKAVVFDRQAEVGGKCQAWYDDEGIFHPLGAAFLSNASYPDTLSVLNQTSVPIEPFALAGARQQYRYNYTSGLVQQVPSLAPQFLAAVSAEIPRYIQLWNTRFRPISAVNYKNGVPDELTVSGAQWFRDNNFTALPILLVNPVALYGYGDINIVPALYILQYFTPDILTAFVGLRGVYYLDFHRMFVEYAKNQLRTTTVHTSADVRSVDRSGENPIITYAKTDTNGTEAAGCKQECSSVIFAFSPNMNDLTKVGVELTDLERETFANVTTHQYYASAIDFAMPFGVSYIANSTSPSIPPPNDGEAVAVLHLSQRSNVSVAWSWGPYEFQSEEEGRRVTVESLATINKDPRNASAPLEPFCDDDIRAFKKYDYFPHFESSALRAGAYDKLNKLQGQKKTYYASSISGMEIVEWAIRSGRDVVDEFFSAGNPGGNGTAPVPPSSSIPAQPSPTSPVPPPVFTGGAGKVTAGMFAVGGTLAALFL